MSPRIARALEALIMQDGRGSKGGALFGAVVVLFVALVVVVVFVLVIWAARGDLTPETLRAWIGALEDPALAAGGAWLLYCLERLSKRSARDAADRDRQEPHN